MVDVEGLTQGDIRIERYKFYSSWWTGWNCRLAAQTAYGAWGPFGVKGCWEWEGYYRVVGSLITTTTSSPLWGAEGI